MKQKSFALLIVLFFSVLLIPAQETRPLIQLTDFSITGVSAEESRLILSLFLSYLSERGELISKIRYEGAAGVFSDYPPPAET